MFVRLNGKKIDLREVRNIVRTNETTFKVQYDDGHTENVAVSKTEPVNSIDLLNALVCLFDNIEE